MRSYFPFFYESNIIADNRFNKKTFQGRPGGSGSYRSDFGSGHDLVGLWFVGLVGLSPALGSALTVWSLRGILSLPVSLPLSTCSLSLSQNN